MTSISVIATVKNEGEALRPLLDSLTHQTLIPHEVVIADGGSTDSTLDILREYQAHLPLRIIDAPDSNISEGRNIAIAAATGDIIAATDAGVVLTPIWVDELTAPIREGHATVVSGWFEPDPYTDFEVVMGATVLPSIDDVEPDSFLPSSRSIAFTKTLWAEVEGYPEWLDFCEDLLFDFALRDKAGPFAFAPRAIAYFRPRGNMRAFAKQYYLYARGDGKANLWRKRHAIRYITYLVGAPLILFLMARGKMSGWLLLAVGTLAYCKRPFERLYDATTGWRLMARLYAFGLVPVIRLVGDVAKMVGYPVGLLWRRRQP